MSDSIMNCPNWMLQDPRTKEEYDRYMQFRIDLGQGFFPVYNYGVEEDSEPLVTESAGGNRFRWVSGGYKHYYQLTKDSDKVYLRAEALDTMHIWVPLDPRWERDHNRSPYSYKDEYRGEPETWNHIPWDSFKNERYDNN